MMRRWAIALGLASCGAVAACANILGVTGDYEIAGSSSASGSGGSGGTGGAGASTSAGGAGGMGGTGSSSSSSSSGATTGGGGTGGMGETSWHRYSFDMASGTWSSALLSSVWTGPNAPPLKGIVATSHLDHFDKLLVFTDTGMLHIQDSGVWKPPVTVQSRFPQIANPGHLAALFHVPSDWNVTPMAMPLTESLSFSDNPTYWTYDYASDDTAKLVEQGTITMDEPPPAPPQSSGRAQWTFEVWNKSKVGTPDGLALWLAYGDGYVYKFPADFVWQRWPVESGPLWAGKPGAPDWASLRASYFIGHPPDGIGTIVFIGP